MAKDANALFLYSDFGSGLEYSDYLAKITDFFALMKRILVKLNLKKLSLILAVKGGPESECDFVDLYEQDSMKLFVQPVPIKFLEEECDMFDWPSVFLKRALRNATDFELLTSNKTQE